MNTNNSAVILSEFAKQTSRRTCISNRWYHHES